MEFDLDSDTQRWTPPQTSSLLGLRSMEGMPEEKCSLAAVAAELAQIHDMAKQLVEQVADPQQGGGDGDAAAGARRRVPAGPGADEHHMRQRRQGPAHAHVQQLGRKSGRGATGIDAVVRWAWQLARRRVGLGPGRWRHRQCARPGQGQVGKLIIVSTRRRSLGWL